VVTTTPTPKVAAPTISTPAVSATTTGDHEIVEMDRMRKLIADHMVMSKQTSPHVTSYVEVDVTNLVRWRDKIKGTFEKREKEKITFTPIFIEAIAKAIKDFPMINVSVDGTKIIVKKNINIGMATALPSGNLIVPVIKNADRLNLLGLTKTVNDLASRARNNKLSPDDIQGGTYTMTNVGTFGNVMGTPIINQPQVAIMAIGAIRKKTRCIRNRTWRCNSC
jgi:2-oxoglutarate dehydrogenase E2 component (dihydrolipoamide succinyltransferase)